MKKSLLTLGLCFAAASGVAIAGQFNGLVPGAKSETSTPDNFLKYVRVNAAENIVPAQLPNSDFTKFEDDPDNKIGDRPIGWKASNVNQMIKSQLVYDQAKAGNGVLMQNKWVGILGIGSNAPAYITLGTPWNYVKGMDPKTGDGGTYGSYAFPYRPDSIQVTYKRVMATENPKEEAKVIFYAWNGQTSATSEKWTAEMIDREQDVLGKIAAGVKVTKSEDFKLISNTEYTIAPRTMEAFDTISIPVNYVDSTLVPQKCNIILSSADYYNRPNIGKDNKLYVKNVNFVYLHELNSFSYNGKTYTAAEAKDGSFDLTDVVYNPTKPFEVSKQGFGATVKTTYNAETAVLTLDILGSDYAADSTSKSSYDIHFKYVAPAAIDSIKIGGENFADFKADQHSYTLPYVYSPGILFEGFAAKGSAMVADGVSKAFYDNVNKTVTLKATNEAADTISYVFNFTEAVEGEESGDYKGGLLVTLTNTQGQESKAPLMSNETLKITKNSNGTVNLAIDNFSFMGLVVGDIFVSNVPVVDNKVSVKKMLRLTSYKEDGSANTSALGWSLGALPLQVNATLYPEVGKFAEAGIDILTGETMLAAMFKNIHVDIVPFEFEASKPIVAEKPWGSVNYYSFIKAKGYITKSSAKFLQLTNSYVNEDSVLIDNPMDYMDLTGATFEKGLKLNDLMVGAPKVNNTLIYVNKDARLFGNNLIKNGETSKLMIKDGIALNAPMDFVARGVDFNRSFVPGQPETVVLPFDVPMSVVNGQAFELGKLNGENFDMVPVVDTLRANKPYVVYAQAAKLFANPGRVSVSRTDSVDASVVLGDLKFQGAYQAKELKANAKDTLTYYMLQGNQFVKVAAKDTLAAFRAMLATENESLADNFGFNIAKTALKGIKVSGELLKEFNPEQHAYTLPFAYNPGIVVEGVPAANELFQKDANNFPFIADNAAKTITVKAFNALNDTVSYVFNFTDEVEAAETGEYKGALSVGLETPYQSAQATPFENSTIKLTKNGNGTVNLAIDNFAFAGLPVGNIFVSNLPVKDNKVSGKRYIRLTSYLEDGTPNPGSMGWMLGILPISVDAVIYPETDKVVDASIDILTGETQLAAMFKNIHVDFVTFQVNDQKFVQGEGGYGLGYYPCLAPTGRVTKASAKFLQTNNSYVNSSKKQINNPMTYLDLTQVKIDADVTLDDVMSGAPVKNNTLVYVPATSSFEGKNLVKGGVAQSLELTDSVVFSAHKAFTAEKVSYDREFETADSVLSSVILPFSVAVENVNGKVYAFEGINGDEMNFKEVSDSLLANRPYLVVASEANLLKNLEKVAVPVSLLRDSIAIDSVDNFYHFGALSPVMVQSKDSLNYYDNVEGQFTKVVKATLVPFRTMFYGFVDNPAEVLVVKLNNLPTGIVGVDAELGMVDVYTVDGKLVRRQVNAATALQGLAKGVYVVGGKKVIR